MRFKPSSSGAAAARSDTVPLFHSAWLFALGITATHWSWLRPGFVLTAVALMAAICCISAMSAQRIVWVPLAALWCLLGAWCGLMEPQPAPAAEVASLSDGLMRALEGTVVDVAPVRNVPVQNVNNDHANDAQAEAELSQRIDVKPRLMNLPAAMQNWPAPLRITQEDAVMLAAMVAEIAHF